MRHETTHHAGGPRRLLFVGALLAVLLAVSTVLTASPVSVASSVSQSEDVLQWTKVHSAQGVRWNRLTFVDDKIGYAVGGDHWDKATGPSSFAKTTDGGLTWVTQKIPGSRHYMMGIACKDALQCWVAGTNQIWATADGGTTWTQLPNPGYGGFFWSTEVARDQLAVLVGTTGYAVDTALNANFLRSINGTSFTKIVVGLTLVQWDIECLPGGVCNSAAKNQMYRSTNYGRTWTRMPVGTANSGRFYGMSCTDANTCWMVGHRVDDGASSPFNPMLYTEDGGKTWIRPSIPDMPKKGHLWDVQMVDNEHGYAVGCDTVAFDDEKCTTPGIVFMTTDGHNWSPVPAPVLESGKNPGLTDLWVFSMNDVYAVDWEGNIWHGTMGDEVTPTPSSTPTTGTVSPTATPTSTETPTETPSPTPTGTATPSPTPTSTETPSPTPSATPALAAVQGVVFHDEDEDGVRDSGEDGLKGASLALRQNDVSVYVTESGDDGVYAFTSVEPGTYALAHMAGPAGYVPAGDEIAFSATAGEDVTLDVPYQLEPTPTPTTRFLFLPLLLR